MEQKVLGIVSPVPMGNWASNTVYQNLNIVRHNGASYIAKSSNTNIEPGVTVGWGSYWMLLNDDGEIGPTGPQGIPGEGVPPGGLAGYVLSKNSNTNYDSKWIPQNDVAAGSAEKDGQGNIIADTYETKQNAQQTYETKSDSMQKYTSLQSQITQNTQTVSRNSKRLDGLEQRINPSPFVTDNSVAYQKDVPSNAVGAVDIQVVGGMTYKDGNNLRSAKVTEVESVGVNLFGSNSTENPQYTGDYYCNPNGIISSNADYNCFVIPIVGGKTYFFWSFANSLPCAIIHFLDDNGLLGVNTALHGKPSGAIIVPSGAKYMRFAISKDTTEDICINESNAAYNGKYYPYVKCTLPIPEAVQSLNGYGEGVNESVYNYIDWEKKQFVKRVGVVDLGRFEWIKGSPTNDGLSNIFYTRFLTMANLSPLLCSKFTQVVQTGVWEEITNGEMLSATDRYIVVATNHTTDAASFKAAMAGVMLYYELATPVVTDISGLITSDNLLSIQGNGILTFENEYGYAVPSTVEYITAEATA